MNFSTFQENCKYAAFAFKDYSHAEAELTCRKPDRKPQGHSWGICNEAYCPFYGIEMRGKLLEAKSGDRTIFKITDFTAKAVMNQID